MSYREEDYLLLSGLQHFIFCRRQWALIHIEHQWSENIRTVDGELFHKRAHDAQQREKRGNLLILRGLPIASERLGLSGQCDVVEFHRSETGIPLQGQEGLYQPFPVEYKRGKKRDDTANALQLCGQAMCLEEMLCCDIPQGALYHGGTKRREVVDLTPALRQEVRDCLEEMHQLASRGYTPKVKPTKSCNACSLKEICLPKLSKTPTVQVYLRARLEEEA